MLHGALTLAIAVFAAAACASPGPTETALPAPKPRPTPASTVAASLSFEPTGIVWCGIIPDWTCTHFIEVVGADGVVHEGWFDNPYPTPPPTPVIIGDVPTRLGPGAYRVTFVKQRVSDTSSQVPVPGGTPRLTNRSDVFAACETAFEVTGPADIRVKVAFEEAACTTTSVVTPRP